MKTTKISIVMALFACSLCPAQQPCVDAVVGTNALYILPARGAQATGVWVTNTLYKAGQYVYGTTNRNTIFMSVSGGTSETNGTINTDTLQWIRVPEGTREWALIQNTGSTDIWVDFPGPATTNSVKLVPNGFWEHSFQESFSVIGTSGHVTSKEK